MSKEFVEQEIDICHQLINEGQYDMAVNRLKMLKNRIHEAHTITQIDMFEKEHDDKLEQRLVEIHESSVDQLRKEFNEATQWRNYATSYLKFYDKLCHEYGL